MRLLFINWAYETHGSAQDLYHYTRVARALGHDVALYGQPDPRSVFNYTLNVNAADAVVFIFEFTTRLTYGEKMAFCRRFWGASVRSAYRLRISTARSSPDRCEMAKMARS